MPFDLKKVVGARMGENYDLHERHINQTLVKVQRTIGFDKVYTHAEGAYLYDADGQDYLDFLSGYSVYNIGRNHPEVKKALHDALDLDLPNMVQLDCSLLSGLLAEALVKITPPQLEACFFTNSGTESVEGALKFARAATGRPRIVSLEGSYHGLSYGSLSITGSSSFQEGFGPFLADVARVPMGDLEALERELASRNVAAFIVEPVQGKGVKFPRDDFFQQAQQLCRKYGTLFICDEIQTGLGRTGKMFAFEHWNLEPDIITIAKSLSGGFVPCGAIMTSRAIYQKTFSRLDRCVVHSTTFGRNNLAMVCGLATLKVIEEENLVENAAQLGAYLEERLLALKPCHAFLHDVRVKGLMCAVEFAEPRDVRLKVAWNLVHKLDPSLFPQMIVTPLLSRHRVLTMVAGHHMDVLKILPPLMIGRPEIDRFVDGLDDVLGQCRKFPGPIWELGTNAFKSALKGGKPARREVESVATA